MICGVVNYGSGQRLHCCEWGLVKTHLHNTLKTVSFSEHAGFLPVGINEKHCTSGHCKTCRNCTRNNFLDWIQL